MKYKRDRVRRDPTFRGVGCRIGGMGWGGSNKGKLDDEWKSVRCSNYGEVGWRMRLIEWGGPHLQRRWMKDRRDGVGWRIRSMEGGEGSSIFICFVLAILGKHKPYFTKYIRVISTYCKRGISRLRYLPIRCRNLPSAALLSYPTLESLPPGWNSEEASVCSSPPYLELKPLIFPASEW